MTCTAHTYTHAYTQEKDKDYTRDGAAAPAITARAMSGFCAASVATPCPAFFASSGCALMYANASEEPAVYDAYGSAVREISPVLNAGCTFITYALKQPLAIVNAPTRYPISESNPKQIVPALREGHDRCGGQTQQR
jgi:hypothetical protein